MITAFASMQIMIMSTFDLDIEKRCIVLSRNATYERINQVLGIGVVLLVLGEWKTSHRLRDVNWFTLYWMMFTISLVASIIILIVDASLAEYPAAFVWAFAIDGKLVNHPRLKHLMYTLGVMLAITTVSITFAIQSSCETKSIAYQYSINVSTSSVSYSIIKNLEYAFIKFKHPSVNVLIDMDNIVENAFSNHGNLQITDPNDFDLTSRRKTNSRDTEKKGISLSAIV
eukprot:CAMPEP_0114487698 /NCGR_PEP_ID=MMETSP0109-20121206/916_1 /TAXON_ID=29199 /ORGANISM="Chlorarachnion reptans, Strain CCCM449" /LENGTH=227 /DNA_ID=CAMNT_0001664003 /DNA_START=92 /DNA_END=775 /DNA_ORIENTATION=+